MASPHSTAPSNPGAFHQGVEQNPNSDPSATNITQPLPSHEMRQKVIEILSNTANGCVHELGYYPGMLNRMQELETRNQRWQQENVKLYEDNKRLTEIVRVQDEIIKSKDTPQSELLNRITHLELDNRSLRVQVEQLNKSRAAESVSHEQRFAALNKEHTNLIDTYNRAYHEILRLRELCKTGRASEQAQQKDQNAFKPLASQPPIGIDGRRPPQSQLPPQSQVGHVSIPNQQAGSAPSPVNVPPANQQFFAQQQQVTIQQQQQYQNHPRGVHQINMPSQQQRHIPHSQDMRQSSNTMNFNGPPNSQQPIPMNMPPSVSIHRPPTISTTQNAPPFQTGPSAAQSHVYQNSDMDTIQSHRRPSLPVPPTDQRYSTHNPQQSLLRPPSQPQIAREGIRTGSAPLPNYNNHSTLPPPPASAPPYPVSLAHSFGSMTSTNRQSSAPPLPTSGGKSAMPTTISPNDINVARPSNTLAAPVPTVPVNAGVLSGPCSPFPTSMTSGPANAIGSKREATNLDQSISENMPGNHKKPRLASSDMATSPDMPRGGIGTTKPRPKSLNVGVSSVPSAPGDTPAHTIAERVDAAPDQGAEAEEEEEEEEVVEVGPDGLRLVEDILEQVYGQNRQGEVVCWFCKYRFEKGVSTVPPTVFNGASDQELEAHCTTNHEVAWNQARASV